MATHFPLQPFLDGTEFMKALRTWQALAQRSLLTFNEPILPGWTVNIDSGNSTAPDTERDILETTSYGKQLGKLTDAVAQLIALVPTQEQDEFREFAEMKKDIDGVKKRSMDKRMARVKVELARLKETDPAEFELVRASLRDVLNRP
jgi:hypothetical protein